MLALQGIPGVYFHSLVGTQNDLAGVEQTGQARRINRYKYQRRELEGALQRAGSLQQRIFTGYQHLLRQRIAQAAFHPEATQRIVHTPQSSVLAFVRDAVRQQILVLVNMAGSSVSIDWSTVPRNDWRHELIADSPVDTANPLLLGPYQAVWLSCES
jgi:sucrose phosphorylase